MQPSPHHDNMGPDQSEDRSQETPLEALARHQVDSVEQLSGELDLLRSIVEHFPGGLCAFDENLNMTICNEYLKKLLNYPPELFGNGLPTIEQLFRFKAERGEYGPGDVEQHIRSRMALVAQRLPHRYERKLPDGRVIEVRGRPLDGGGFVTTYMDVTEKRQNNSQLEAVINGFPGGIAVFDSNFQMTYCNEALKNRISKAHELFTSGMPSMEQYIWHNARQGAYGGDDLSQTVARRIRAIRSGRIFKHDILTAHGNCIEVTVIPLKDGGFVETHVDVSENRTRGHQLEAIVEHFPGAVAMFDKDLKLVLHNQQHRQMWNYPAELIEDRQATLRELIKFNAQNGEFPDTDIDEYIENRMAALQSGGQQKIQHQRPDGSTLEILSTPIEGGGIVTTYFDITERLAQEARSVQMAYYSQVTGMPNRALFQDRLNIALAQAERGTNIAVHHIDIHNFKRVNDTAGQRTGDKILRVLGGRLM